MSFSSLIIVFLVGIASFYFLSFVEPVANVRLALGGILLGLVLLLITMVVSTARLLDQTLFQPLQNLHESSQRIAEGDFNQQIVAVQQDEIGEFATVLDEMRQALRLRDTRIAAQNKALGEEVNSRKIAQEKLQKLNAELVQSSRYKDQFLATMSHELRTPLNAILGMSEALIVPVYGELNDQQRKAVLHVRDSGRHLLSLIDDILDLSKIAAGRSPLETSVLEIEPIIDASVGMIRPISDAKRLTMRTFVDPQARILIADEQRLKQILINLLNNAVKFTHEGGMISLIVRGRHSDNAIEIEVADTGIGIPQASLEHLFEPFVQIDGSLSRQHGGAGLGLTLVQRLVDMHNGSIRVASESGRGSHFYITLPWEQKEQLSSSRPPASRNDKPFELPFEEDVKVEKPPQTSKKTTILLAEDREANILTLLDYLTIKGFHVIVARNGIEAVEMTRTQTPNLILMDIQMPEMNGIEAIETIRADSNAIPIIALTALAMPGDRERCLAVGADDYLSKPISLRQLVVAIEKLLAKRLNN